MIEQSVVRLYLLFDQMQIRAGSSISLDYCGLKQKMCFYVFHKFIYFIYLDKLGDILLKSELVLKLKRLLMLYLFSCSLSQVFLVHW